MAADSAEDAARTLENIADAIGGAFTEEELFELGDAALTMVLLRTKKGLDADGKPFTGYTPAYAKERKEHSLATSPVDLVRTGHMLGALARYPNIADQSVMLGFESEFEAMKAAAHNDGVDKVVQSKGYIGTVFGQRTAAGGYTFVNRKKANKKAALDMHVYEVEDGMRRVRQPKREFLGVRLDAEIKFLTEDVLGREMTVRIEKAAKKR